MDLLKLIHLLKMVSIIYTILSVQICLSDKLRIYYPESMCYEYNFGASKKTITLMDNGEPIYSFQRIV